MLIQCLKYLGLWIIFTNFYCIEGPCAVAHSPHPQNRPLLTRNPKLVNSYIESYKSCQEFELQHIKAQTLHVKLPTSDPSKAQQLEPDEH